MNWFSGDIASAIAQAKSNGSVFVVYCAGKDDNSKQMTELIDNEQIKQKLESDLFVAVKIESDKEDYIHFAKIYQVVPVPSIFFIRNGIPVKVVTGATKTVAELEEAIKSVLNNETSQQQQKAQSSSQQEPAKTTKNDESEVVCEGGVCYKKPKEADSLAAQTAQPSSPTKTETEEEKQEKIKKAMKLIEQKRIERVKEEARLEKEREIQRRKEGQALQDLKKWQEDSEIKQLKDDRIKEKAEAKAARQRVLDQIEQDKKERAARFATTPVTPTESKPVETSPPKPPVSNSNTARIQFKKPDGESEIVTFDSDMLFADVHAYVKDDILRDTSIREFILAQAFPRKEFSSDDFDKTLAALGLTPSAVLLIIPGKKSASSSGPSSVLPTQTEGLFDMLSTVVMGMLSPVWALIGYLRNLVTGNPAAPVESANEAGKRKRNEELLMANDAAKRRNLSAFNQQPGPSTSGASSSPTGTIPKTGAYKRPSTNIHRLHQNDSDDEEKKTYNGNSTQQM